MDRAGVTFLDLSLALPHSTFHVAWAQLTTLVCLLPINCFLLVSLITANEFIPILDWSVLKNPNLCIYTCVCVCVCGWEPSLPSNFLWTTQILNTTPPQILNPYLLDHCTTNPVYSRHTKRKKIHQIGILLPFSNFWPDF